MYSISNNFYHNNHKTNLLIYTATFNILKELITILIDYCRVAGTAGAVVTCPLEVVKTRLQSSRGVGVPPPGPPPSDNATSTKKVCSKIPKHQVIYISNNIRVFIKSNGYVIFYLSKNK